MQRYCFLNKQHYAILDCFISLSAHKMNFVKSIRNIGIVAHVDAGKTSITENFLFLGGTIRQKTEDRRQKT